MRRIEVRRHAPTKKGPGRGAGSHLSAEGVRLARAVGQGMGRFARVLTSTIPRTLETALAMGFAVDDQLAALGEVPLALLAEIGHHDRWTWDAPFARFAALVAQGDATTVCAAALRALWVAALESVPDGGQVLVISHGRLVEIGLVACAPDGDYTAWGAPFRHCEGVRLTYADGRFRDPELLRLAWADDAATQGLPYA